MKSYSKGLLLVLLLLVGAYAFTPLQAQETTLIAGPVVRNMQSRVVDVHGSGQYEALRGNHTHRGLDIRVSNGQEIMAPFEGTITRIALPYASDANFKGLVLKGRGKWSDYTVKIFYANGLLSGNVEKGQAIALAQDISTKYAGITKHIHIEVKKNGRFIDPFEIWQMSF